MNQHANVKAAFSDKMKVCGVIGAVLVMWCHCYNVAVYDNVSSDAVYWFEEVLTNLFARAAVPYFFMQSAFFLYDKTKNRRITDVYKSRFWSTLVPYLSWNIIYMIAFGILTKLSLSSYGMTEITVENIFRGIFYNKYNYTFWFMRYLIFFIVLYPIFSWIISRGKRVALLGLVLVFIGHWAGVLPKSEQMVYYYIGAVLGYHFNDEVAATMHVSKKKKLILVLALLLIGLVLFFGVNVCNYKDLEILRNIVMVAFMFFGIDLLNIKPNGFFWGLSFMIYALHPLILEMVEKLIYILLPHNVVWMVLDYLLAPFITLGIIVVVTAVWKRILPGLYKVLNGGRI